MNELKFTRQDYIKYDSMRIYIHNAKLKLVKEDFRIINEFEETDYGYKKAVVELGSDLCKIMCDIQHQINVYLKRNRLPLQTLIYKDKVYCKTHFEVKFLLIIYGLIRKRNAILKYGLCNTLSLNNYNFCLKKIMIVL